MDGSIKRIGCYIVGVFRIAALIAQKKLLNKVYTEYE